MAIEVLLWCIAVLLATAPAAVVGARRTTMTFVVYAIALVVSIVALATGGWALVTDAGTGARRCTCRSDCLGSARTSDSTRWPRRFSWSSIWAARRQASTGWATDGTNRSPPAYFLSSRLFSPA